MMNKYVGIFLLCCLLASTPAKAAVDAQVDRQNIVMGEAVNLVIHANQNSSNTYPDLAPLKKDFNLISQGEQSQISIINGNSTMNKMWYVALSPRRTGDLTIPAIRVGDDYTDAISIKVTPASNHDNSDKEIKDIFIKTILDTKETNVQGQILYTTQLFYDRNIQNAELTDPQFDDGMVIRLDKDASFQKTINGIVYQVIERHYAIIPDKSGDLTILAPTLTGNVVDKDAFSKNNFEVLSTLWEPVRITANPTTLHVKPIPAGIPVSEWLPAKSLTIKESWSPDPAKFQVGQPLTRTITIEATGTIGDKLPDLSMANRQGLQVYPDKPLIETHSDGASLLAKRVDKIAIIPTDAGTIQLPPITVKWWNTTTNSLEIATLPKKTIQVMPGAEQKNNLAPLTPTLAAPTTQAEIKTDASIASSFSAITDQWRSFAWMSIASLLFLLWILTLWRLKKTKQAPHHPYPSQKEQISFKAAQKNCKAACLGKNPKACQAALLQWATHLWPQHTFRSLSDVEKKMTLEETKQLLRELNKVLYTDDSALWDGKKLWACLLKETKTRKKNHAPTLNTLPRLYPE